MSLKLGTLNNSFVLFWNTIETVNGGSVYIHIYSSDSVNVTHETTLVSQEVPNGVISYPIIPGQVRFKVHWGDGPIYSIKSVT